MELAAYQSLRDVLARPRWFVSHRLRPNTILAAIASLQGKMLGQTSLHVGRSRYAAVRKRRA